MNGWPELDRFLRTDPRDVGCAAMLGVFAAAGLSAQRQVSEGMIELTFRLPTGQADRSLSSHDSDRGDHRGQRGIGRATARLSASAATGSALIARGADGLDRAADEVTRAGGTRCRSTADMADFSQRRGRGASRSRRTRPDRRLGQRRASAPSSRRSRRSRPEEFRRVTEVSYLGFVHGTMVALRRMRARDHGTIVQVGSALA